MWFERTYTELIASAVNTRPVLLLTGARQTGKSSLLKKLYPDHPYVTLDSIQYAEQAKQNPDYFLSSLKKPVILDEVQYAPELFRQIKIFVDQDRSAVGQWLLTGSQKFELMKSVGDSLAGRIRIIHLETLSSAELRGKLNDINDFIWKGGYPELWKNPKINSREFFDDYVQTYIERDLRKIINISDLVEFQRFLKICASRTGQLINYRNLSKDVGVSDVTVKNWLSALEQSGIIYRLPPFYANIGKRFVKASKLYFADHGLACYLLNILNLEQWHSHIYKGNLWENLVFCELIKSGRNKPGRNLFFYRDQNGVEMDFVIENEPSHASPITLIEAKASENINNTKLNFMKIAPLFKNKEVKCFLLANCQQKTAIKLKDYTLLNPLYRSLDLN